MKRLRVIIAILLMTTGLVSNAQNTQRVPSQADNPKLIAVVNRANWCAVCKANAERFGALIMPYTVNGLNIYINDLTNDTTKATSKSALEEANIYEAVTTRPRKGFGKMLQSCGLEKGKKQSLLPSGIVTFINPQTKKQIKQLSIAVTNKEMKATIEDLLKQQL